MIFFPILEIFNNIKHLNGFEPTTTRHDKNIIGMICIIITIYINKEYYMYHATLDMILCYFSIGLNSIFE
jgi:hypothetical protein